MPIMDQLRLEVFGKRLRRQRKDQQRSTATVGRIDAGPAELALGVGEWKTAPCRSRSRSTASAVPWAAPVDGISWA